MQGGGRAFAVACVASVCGCSPSDDATATVKIGMVMDLSDEFVEFTEPLVRAAELAVREINSAGGLPGGQQLELVSRSDKGIPDEAVTQVKALIDEERVVALTGFDASWRAADVVPVALERQVPMVSCCATSDEFTTAHPERDRYFFRTAPPDVLQAPVMAQAASSAGCQRLAIVHRDDPYGNPFADLLAPAFTELGGEVAISRPYDPDAASYVEDVQMVEASAPDCIAMIALAPDFLQFRNDWNSTAATDVEWLASDGVAGASFDPEDAGVLDGLLVTVPDPAPDNERYRAFRDLYRLETGGDPGSFTAFQYDATAALALAIASAGDMERADIRDALYDVSRPDPGDVSITPGALAEGLAAIELDRPIDYQGASGPVDFDDCGNVFTNYMLFQFDGQGGEFAPLEVLQVVEGPPCP